MLHARSRRMPSARVPRVLLAAAGLLALTASANSAYAAGKLALPLALDWKYTANRDGNNPASPVADADTVYFASGDRMYAVDIASGAMKWRYPEDQPLSTRVRTTPVIVGDMLYAGAEDGKLYALQTANGHGKWLFDTRSQVGSSPVAADGVLYFGSADGRVWAIDTRTGNEVPTWRGGYKAGDEVAAAPAVANGLVFVLSLDQVLHAVGASSGKQRATVRLGGSVLGMAPVVYGDNVYVAAGATLYCFSSRNLSLRWTQMLPNDIACSPVVNEFGAYVVTRDSRLYSFESRLGRPRWKTAPKLEYDVLAAPAAVGDMLVVGTVLGAVYVIDGNTGASKWLYTTQPASTDPEALPTWTNVAATPVVADDRLLVLSDDGSLACFRTGALDSLPPDVTILEPEMGIVMNGNPPIRFEAKIADVGSGVNPATVRVLIDGDGIVRRPDGKDNDDKPGYYFDLRYATVTYDTPEPTTAALVRPLPDGRHTVTISAADWAGNMVNKTWSFTVDNSVAKRPRKKPTDQMNNMGPGGMGGLRGGPGGGSGMPGMGSGSGSGGRGSGRGSGRGGGGRNMGMGGG